MEISKDEDPILLIGYVYILYNKIDKAINLLNSILSVEPNNIPALSLLAFALNKIGRIEDAMSTLDKLHTLGWNNPQYYLLKSKILENYGNEKAARQAIEMYKSMNIQNNNPNKDS